MIWRGPVHGRMWYSAAATTSGQVRAVQDLPEQGHALSNQRSALSREHTDHTSIAGAGVALQQM